MIFGAAMQIHQIIYHKAIEETTFSLAPSPLYRYCLFHGAAATLAPLPPIRASGSFIAFLRPQEAVTVERCGSLLLYDLLEFAPNAQEQALLDHLPLPVSPTVPPNPQELSNRLRVIEEVYYSANKYRTGVVDAEFLLLLYDTASGDEEESPDLSPKKLLHQKMRRLRTLISDDPARFQTVGEAAAFLNLSTSYFSALYRDYFNTSFIQEVIRAKTKRASALLLTTEYSVTEIAQKLGYRNEGLFYKQFKSQTGMTPNEYRKQATRAF